MASTPNIALAFLATKESDFTYEVFRKRIPDNEASVPETRYLPQNCTKERSTATERHRYEISFEAKPGFEKVRLPAWIEQGLTDEVLHQALIRRIQDAGLEGDTEVPEERHFLREVAFVLARHGDVREVMWLRAYGLQIIGRFGFLCHYALRVPPSSTMPETPPGAEPCS